MAIKADPSLLPQIAVDIAADHLFDAKKHIDFTFGDGYAAKNPGLVAAFLKAAGDGHNTCISAIAVQEAAERIEIALQSIADRIS
ncbi:hypothetical protein [Pseudomonas alabamensis]|uniref:hypothetical protein n=1 Tax=Pseudomonas alabamensis TaxID=3064349 RepID=UPI000745D4AD|nr:hypothetical protein APT63_11955 [Pseudomonas monteilii]